MAYIEKIFDLNSRIEYEYTYMGKYGAKGEKRAPRAKPTPEQIERQNQTNKSKYVRRLILLNFQPGDLWTTLKYPAGARPHIDKVKTDFKEFRRLLRKAYKKAGRILKYIYRIEVGELGGIHIHILVNRIWDPGVHTDLLIAETWSECLKKSLGKGIKTDGLADYTPAYEAGGFQQLADYITKKPKPDTPEYEQLTLFPAEEQKQLVTYNRSRNLILPEPEVKQYSHWTMRKLLAEGPKPTKGYYIDKDSIVCGINKYTGLSYYRYTEIKMKSRYGPGGVGW